MSARLIELDARYSATRRVHSAMSEVGASESNGKGLRVEQCNNNLHSSEKCKEGGLRISGYKKKGEQSKPLITVVTVVYNGEKHLEETILSVIGQTYCNVEYIIIDGCSSDLTLDIIKKYEHVIDYWVSEKDDGIYDAWNKAVKLATGDFIGFLGSDDVYLPDALEVYGNFLNNNRCLEYLSSRVELVSDVANVRTIGKPWSWQNFRRFMCTAHVGSLHSRSLFDRYGLFNSNYRIVGDYEFLLRAGPTLKAGFVESVTARMRIGGVSYGSKLALTEAREVKIKNNAVGYFFAFWDYIVARLKLFLRKILNKI